MGRSKRWWGLMGILAMMLLLPPVVLAQWGTIQRGVESTRPAPSQGLKSPEKDTPHNVADEKVGGAGLPSNTTFTNKVRPFSYTIPAGWRQESGDPTGERVVFMKPGTTCSFQFHFTQMVPSFPRAASVDASLKTSKEEMSIGKYQAVKRRDQGTAKAGVIGWEVVETPKGGGGSHQRIIWQCYDGQNFYYNFMTASHPDQFNTHRAALQGIIDSIRFSR